MRMLGIPFQEHLLRLETSDFSRQLATVYDGSTVPVLVDGETVIWESLAIIEYLAERFPGLGVWPREPGARALARAMSAEMHAGFAALRSACPMNLGKRFSRRDRGAECAADVGRICRLWRRARETYGQETGEPYLFGSFSAVDAMYAPVVTRFDTYAIDVPDDAQDYMASILGSAAFSEWYTAALREPWIYDADEVDEPAIKNLRHP